MGRVAWNKGQVGVYEAWNKGQVGVYSDETLEKMSKAKLGKPSNRKGKTLSEETKKKISESKKGTVAHHKCKGVPWSAARRKAYEQGVAKTGTTKKDSNIGRPKKVSNTGRTKSKYASRGKEYGEGWVELRKEVYQRDRWLCQECGAHCHNSTKRKIQCHHIDYDVKNNDLSNLITLCASCHGRTNGNRSDWIAYFEIKQKGKY